MQGYIAQLVEHWTFNPQVLGSNPCVPKITNNGIFKYKLLFKYNNYSFFYRNVRIGFK